MSEDPKLRRAMELAARIAVETYGASIVKQMQAYGHDLRALAGNGHELKTVIIDNHGNTVLITARWDFTASTEETAEVVRRAKSAGQG